MSGADGKTKSELLGIRATTKVERTAEYKKRKQRFVQRRIHQADREKSVAEGWSTTGRQYKDGQIQVERTKSHDEILENRVWSVLYHFGYDELNVGRKFKIQITDSNKGDEVWKQVDIFAKDEDTVVIAECKSSATKSSASFQKDIMEFAALKKSFAKSVTALYGKEAKLKFIWLMVTRNIILSANDLKRAEHEQINIVGDRDLRYYEEIARNIGKAAKYQFLAEFLEGAKVKNLEDHQVPAIRAKVGGHQAYYFMAPPERLLPIAFVNHRSLRDPTGNPAYQRLVKRKRLNQIGQFLDDGGFFPNSILVNFKKRPRFDIRQSYEDRQIAFGDLFLPDAYKTAWIIDGQHRLYGFAETNKKRRANVIAVVAFENISREMEADLFATINGKQAKVSKNILDELEGDLKFDSEDFKSRIGAIASRSLALLDAENGGPFNDRFNTPETEESDAACLTISELKKAIVQSGLIGKPGSTKDRPPQPGYATRTTSEETLEALSDLLSAYFEKIRHANLDRWELGRPSHLCMNIGVAGHIRLLAALCDYLAVETKQDPAELDPEELVEQLASYVEPVLKFIAEASDADFESHFKPVFGSGGPPRYFFELVRLVNQDFPTFSPHGFDDYVNTKSSEESRKADEQVRGIIDRTHVHVIEVLKAAYGERYYTAGIPQKEIRMKGFERQQDADVNEQLDPITYLDLVDLKKIVEHKNNWPHFEATMNIKMPDDRKGNAKNISWFDTLNDIRKIMAHPANRSYKASHYEFLNILEDELQKRLGSSA
ncbi:DGQHR domain-containing protein [Bradyrhizobium symbiodeficiens]|uniref:DGQHR domain-containing protein n=1 Tax=Bradyrhizobium symbiodeficiens TaxID=1404367 RepID=A0ABX5WFF4_9BRAD|nr:DGQHR domain-containing protein [Bradyrhizobium symbiodeficiens]QDF41980.1 DGQHR domain-containing protein [Bradyrhizobium symbiodeficiens]